MSDSVDNAQMDSSTAKQDKISEEERPDFSPSRQIISEEEADSLPKKLIMIPKKDRSDVLDPFTRPSVSASRPLEVKFERERREMSVSPARKTITDHSKDSEPITPSDRADLSAVIARKTVNLTPLAPLSLKERRELVRSISIVVKEPETPLWFSQDTDDTESGEQIAEEEAEKVDGQPSHRAPELTLGRSRFASPAADAPPDESKPSTQFNRAASLRLTRAPTKRIFPTPNFKDEEVLNPFSRKERKVLMRTLSMAVTSADVPLWRTDSTDVSESEDVQPRYERIKAPLLPPELEELKKEVNKQKVDVLNEGQFLPMHWSSVVVGDIVRVKRDHQFPADLVFLSSSDAKGLAYIETSNLDGEPSLKIRNAFYKGTQSSAEEEDETSLSIFSGLLIECELPNNRLYKFEGAINLQDYGKLPLDIRQILLRGATLRNTDWILGVVVYTGADTKFVRNMIPGHHKITELERNMNILVALVFICQVALCIGLAVGQDNWARQNTNLFYIPYDIFKEQVGIAPSEIGAQFGRFLILLNQLIPISLYVTLEVVKVVQSYLLDHDLQMYHEPTNTFARARTTNLNEELGQVQYVMSDKTGTLTQNLMAFVQCSISGAVYGNPVHVAKSSEGAKSPTIHTAVEDKNLQGMLKQITEGSKEAAAMSCHAFFSHLAICHVIQPVQGSCSEPEGDAKESTAGLVNEGSIKYVGPSPDEEALVKGAADCGYRLKKRTTDELQVEMPGMFF